MEMFFSALLIPLLQERRARSEPPVASPSLLSQQQFSEKGSGPHTALGSPEMTVGTAPSRGASRKSSIFMVALHL